MFKSLSIAIPLLASLAIAAPYPQSPVIKDIQIEDTGEISFGDGDNFPMTWADDGKLYTMYCDGVGFDAIPYNQYLSNGFAELTGHPPYIQGHNIPSPDIEFHGGGRSGLKASGLLSIDGNLYALVRNLDRKGHGSLLYWSSDKGKTWTASDWNWPEIGIADWLNMGQDYRLNEDGYAYFIGHNGPDAYEIYDSFMMARVPTGEITAKEAYEYFAGWEGETATWTKDIEKRAPVFELPEKCYRPCIIYNPGIDRYMLFTMPFTLRREYDRYLGIFDAPNPWGPWTRAAEITDFKETRYHPRVPSKWISDDGLTFHYNFSILAKYKNGEKGFDKRRYRFNLDTAKIILQNPPAKTTATSPSTATGS